MAQENDDNDENDTNDEPLVFEFSYKCPVCGKTFVNGVEPCRDELCPFADDGR